MKRVFIASSGDLENERKELEILLYRENFKPVVWESIDHSITNEKFQKRINRESLTTSDTVIFMIKAKLGKYTIEELKESFKFLENKIEKIYIYFFEIDKNKISDEELFKRLSLQRFLKNEEKFYREIKDFNELKSHFLEQKKYINSQSANQYNQHINNAKELLILISNAPNLYTSVEILKKIDNEITKKEILNSFETLNNFFRPRKKSLLLAYILSKYQKEIYLRIRDEYLPELGNPEISKLMRLFNADINIIKECNEMIQKRFFNKFVVVDCDYVWLGTNQSEINKLLESSAITMSAKYIQIECPRSKVNIKSFQIAKFAVTNKEYSLFDENHYYPNEEEHYPATNLTWNNALKFAKWWGAKLPTEAEWVAAARGNTDFIYTWGNKFDKVLCNCEDTEIRHKLPVDSFPEGVSQFGCFNMIGNCWEMTSSLLRDFPYNPDDGRENLLINENRVIKGGSYSSKLVNLRCDSRDYRGMDAANSKVGFRLIINKDIF